MRFPSYKKYFFALIGIGLFASGCGGINIKSQWTNQAVAVDGGEDDWRWLPGSDQSDITFKAMNDDKFLYLYLSSSSREIKSQLVGAFKQSFDIWFDLLRKKKRINGVSIAMTPDHSVGYPKIPVAESDYLATALRILSVEMPGQKENPRILAADSQELALAMVIDHGKLIIELKVPLQADAEHPYSIGAQVGETIHVGFTSSKIDPYAAQEELELENEVQESETSASGAAPSGARSRHHRGGGGAPRQGAFAPSPLELWGDLKLAKR